MIKAGVVIGALVGWAALTARADTLIELRGTRGTEARIADFRATRLPQLQSFLEQWREVVPLPKRLTLIFTEKSWSGDHREALEEVYGPEFRAKARKILDRLQSFDLPLEALKAVYDEAYCEFPGFGTAAGPLLNWESARFMETRELGAMMRKKLMLLLDDRVPPKQVNRVFNRTGPTTIASRGSECGTIVFGALRGNGPPPDEIIDAVLHEAGHWIDLSTRPDVARFIYTQAMDESLADIFAHLALGRSCHYTNKGDLCSRDLAMPSTFEEIRKDPAWFLTGDYVYGQPLRYVAWTLFSQTAHKIYAPALLAARDAAILKAPAADRSILNGDAIPREVRRTLAEGDAQTMQHMINLLQGH